MAQIKDKVDSEVLKKLAELKEKLEKEEKK